MTSSADTDKHASGYVPTYLALAAELGAAARVCEVGVLDGGSLALWQELFSAGDVTGVDVDPRAVWLPGTHRVVAEQTDPRLPDLVDPGHAGFDLVIDDASHQAAPTMRTWALLWPLVRPGGVYVIEDWTADIVFPGCGYEGLSAACARFVGLLTDPDQGIAEVRYLPGMILIRAAGRPDR